MNGRRSQPPVARFASGRPENDLMSQALPKRKPVPRLRTFDYKGQFAYSITICTSNKSSVFTEEEIVDNILEILYAECTKMQFGLLAYCFMPDHLHFLLTGNERSELIKIITRFKQTSSFRFRKTYGKPLWQRGYYDHVLRKDEDVEVVAHYIWSNPIRKGLVELIKDYPFSGPREYLIDGPT